MKTVLRREVYLLVMVAAVSLFMVGAALALPSPPREPYPYHHLATPIPTTAPTPIPSSGGSTSTSSAAVNSPNLGLILIYTSQAQPVYASPGGEIVRVDGQELWLPNDADGSGADSYVVMELALVDGEVWVAIFLGSAHPGWVPLDTVTPVTYLGEDALLDAG